MPVFRKQLMIDRIIKEGNENLIDDEVRSIMDLLDGKEALTYTWNNMVKDEEPRYIINVNGENYPINSQDCE